jgi:hypothetical protein
MGVVVEGRDEEGSVGRCWELRLRADSRWYV